jgi:hypothetical protein
LRFFGRRRQRVAALSRNILSKSRDAAPKASINGKVQARDEIAD